MSEPEVDSIYGVKRVSFYGADVGIVLQNENGPCPAIAIMNCLLLKQWASLPRDRTAVAFSEIVTLATGALKLRFQNRGLSADPNAQFNMNEALAALPLLEKGLDVNVRFGSIDDFELGVATACFDVFGLRLVHGWLPAEGEPHYEAVKGQSYNGLIEMIIKRNDERDKATAWEKQQKEQQEKEQQQQQPADAEGEGGVPAPPLEAGPETAGGAADGEGAEPAAVEAAEGGPAPGGEGEAAAPISSGPPQIDEAAIRAGTLAEQFLNETSGQLTYNGLFSLARKLEEKELCVFFRNNHFSTLTKHQGRLYVLVTDVGYQDVSGVVWETLTDLDGDTNLLDSKFQRASNLGRQANVMQAAQIRAEDPMPAPVHVAAPAAVPAVPQQVGAGGGLGARQMTQEESDFHLAQCLAEEERSAADARVRQQQQMQMQMQRHPQQQDHQNRRQQQQQQQNRQRQQQQQQQQIRRQQQQQHQGSKKDKDKDKGCCVM